MKRKVDNYFPKRLKTLSLCWIEGYRETKVKMLNRIYSLEISTFSSGENKASDFTQTGM